MPTNPPSCADPATPRTESDGVLTLPAASADRAAARDALNVLRRFHHGLTDPKQELAPPRDWLPALLHAYRAACVRTDYPLLLGPGPNAEGDAGCTPLSELLTQTLKQLAPGDEDARILKDNLARLERHVREELDAAAAPADAAAALGAAGERMLAALSLGSESARQLQHDLGRLLEAIPAGSRLLPLTEDAAVILAAHVAVCCFLARRGALREEAELLCARLHDLQRAEAARHVSADGAASVGSAFAQGGALVDPGALARVMASANRTAAVDPQRRGRIERALATLRDYLEHDAVPPVVIVHDAASVRAARADRAEWRSVRNADVCRTAAAVFDELVASHAALFTAMRTARLELAGAYDPERHDRLLENLHWESLTRDELLALPRVLALPAAREVVGPGMPELSRLLASGRPVQVLVAVDAALGVNDDQSLREYRFELSYLGLSHREALVHQSSPARPVHLAAGFCMSAEAAASSLHVISRGPDESEGAGALGAWLHAGAALEGRAHTLFHYNPEAGATWARRFNLANNPAPDQDWPKGELSCRTLGGEEMTLRLAFTFADFALLEPRFRRHFSAVLDDLPTDVLTPLAEYLELPAEKAADALPFIWTADARGGLHRVAVDRELALACRDRLDYWRTLQELAGIRNEHVREAVQRERERLAAEFAAERQQLERAHAAGVERARREAAGEAMQRLAQTLLEIDLSAAPSQSAAAPATSAAPQPPVAAGAPADAAAAKASSAADETDLVPREPWITTALCTSCNDCINLNPQMFVYNANKQAVIKNPAAGSYAQLVAAAEKCPARCIHPGLPLDPNEADAEKLIERAKPFN